MTTCRLRWRSLRYALSWHILSRGHTLPRRDQELGFSLQRWLRLCGRQKKRRGESERSLWMRLDHRPRTQAEALWCLLNQRLVALEARSSGHSSWRNSGIILAAQVAPLCPSWPASGGCRPLRREQGAVPPTTGGGLVCAAQLLSLAKAGRKLVVLLRLRLRLVAMPAA
jgi:hypothetical protein